MEKVVSLAVGLYSAVTLGDYAARMFWAGQANAGIYGMATAFVIGGGLAWLIIDRMEREALVAFAFSGFMAYQYGTYVGLRYLNENTRMGAAMYGGLAVFMVAMVAGVVVVYPISRAFGFAGLGALARGRRALKNKSMPLDALTPSAALATIEAGTVMSYVGLIDRKVNFPDGAGTAKAQLIVHYTLSRNTMAMTPREREGVKLWQFLRFHGLLSRADEDSLQFALTWGDGRSQVSGPSFSGPAKMMHGLGLRNLRDAVTYEAAYRDATSEGALSHLFTILQSAASDPGAHPDIKALYKSYSS